MRQFDAAAIPNLFKGLRRRHLLLPAILLVHLLLLAFIALFPPAAIATRLPPVGLTVIDVSADSAEPLPPSPAPPPPTPEEVIMPEPRIELPIDTQTIMAAPIFKPATAAAAGFGTTCDVAATLVRAFEHDPAARAHLQRIGPKSRSVANAIMFWDGAWVSIPGEAPLDALDAVRLAILEGARAAPPECQVQPVAGPRFISVKDGERTTTLVIGSGEWRWDQLIASATPLGPDPSGIEAAAPAVQTAARTGGAM